MFSNIKLGQFKIALDAEIRSTKTNGLKFVWYFYPTNSILFLYIFFILFCFSTDEDIIEIHFFYFQSGLFPLFTNCIFYLDFFLKLNIDPHNEQNTIPCHFQYFPLLYKSFFKNMRILKLNSHVYLCILYYYQIQNGVYYRGQKHVLWTLSFTCF